MKVISLFLGLMVLAQTTLAETRVGIYYQMTVSDPSSMVAALDTFRSSAAGKKTSAQVTLSQIMANGSNPATHALSVSYASGADMDKSQAATRGSKEWAALQKTMSEIMTPVSETMFRTTEITAGSSDEITSPNAVSRFILMDVEDPAAYVAAWNKMMASRNSNLPSGIFQVMSAGTAGISHGVSITANNMAEMMELMDANQGNPDWAEFLAAVEGIRTVEDDSIVVRIKSWGI
jgi:hypothetical protein